MSFPFLVGVSGLCLGTFLGFSLELLETVMDWRFESLSLFLFLFYNASRWMGTRMAFSDGLALAAIVLVGEDMCILIDNVI